MSAAIYVNQARRAAGLSQRELSRRTGVPQSAITRIERGQQVPRADTLEKLLKACGFELRLGPARGGGVDTKEIDRFLQLTPAERLERAVAAAHVAKAYGIPDQGQTIGAVLRLALEDTVVRADE
jgi:transcriptional regulator with XRE-family HTH domain